MPVFRQWEASIMKPSMRLPWTIWLPLQAR